MLGAIETGNLSDVLLLKESIKEYKNISEQGNKGIGTTL